MLVFSVTTQDKESRLWWVNTSRFTEKIVPVEEISKPLVTANDDEDYNKLWILNHTAKAYLIQDTYHYVLKAQTYDVINYSALCDRKKEKGTKTKIRNILASKASPEVVDQGRGYSATLSPPQITFSACFASRLFFFFCFPPCIAWSWLLRSLTQKLSVSSFLL